MPTPRHGHGGHSTLPVKLEPSERLPASPRYGVGSQPPQPQQPAPNAFGAVPVGMVQGFLSLFPSPDVQQVARHDSYEYDLFTAGSTASITSLTIPNGMAMIVTDVEFFATTPSPYLTGALIRYPVGAFAGQLRWQLLFNDRSPLEMEGTFISPRGTRPQLGVRSGWPFLNKTFGVDRAPSFAIFARESVTIEARVTVDVVPEAIITTVGVLLNGFTLPMMTFSKAFPSV